MRSRASTCIPSFGHISAFPVLSNFQSFRTSSETCLSFRKPGKGYGDAFARPPYFPSVNVLVKDCLGTGRDMSAVGAASVAADAVGAGLCLRGYSVGMLQKENGASDWTRCPGAFGYQALGRDIPEANRHRRFAPSDL